MDLLDEKGNVLGVINVVDALVGLAVLAVVFLTVGIVLNAGGPAQTTPDGYATVVFDPQPAGTAAPVGENTRVARIGGEGTYTVTDTYRTITANGSVVTVVQLAVPGDLESPISPGDRYGFRTDTTRLGGIVRATTNRSTLRTATKSVTIETVRGQKAVDRIDTGDTIDIYNETVGSLQSIWAYPRGNSGQYEAQMTVSLQTICLNGQHLYATTPLRPGEKVPLRFDSGLFNGTVERVGETNEDPERTTIVVEWRNVDPSRANEITAGLNEDHPGPGATVQNVSVRPATVVVTTSSGELVTTTHPSNKDVTLTVDAPVSILGERAYFHGEALSVGQSVHLEFGRTVVNGTVVDYQGS